MVIGLSQPAQTPEIGDATTGSPNVVFDSAHHNKDEFRPPPCARQQGETGRTLVIVTEGLSSHEEHILLSSSDCTERAQKTPRLCYVHYASL